LAACLHLLLVVSKATSCMQGCQHELLSSGLAWGEVALMPWDCCGRFLCARPPSRRLLWGIPGRSNALNIAQRLGLDGDLVAAARERLGEGAAEVRVALNGLKVQCGCRCSWEAVWRCRGRAVCVSHSLVVLDGRAESQARRAVGWACRWCLLDSAGVADLNFKPP
jgi:hypothetical protein